MRTSIRNKIVSKPFGFVNLTHTVCYYVTQVPIFSMCLAYHVKVESLPVKHLELETTPLYLTFCPGNKRDTVFLYLSVYIPQNRLES